MNTFDKWDDDNVNIKINLLRGIYANGFEQPSPIQKQAIIPMTQGKDLIAQAQSGTGKTGAFTIGMLQYIDETIQETQAIILSPTRELACQTNTVINNIGKMMNIKTCLTTGTISVNETIKEMEQQPHIIVGCPGRLNDMLRRDKVILKNLS